MYNIKKYLYLIVFIGYSVSYAGAYEDFFSAVERDDAWQVQSLLDRGVDPNSVSPQGQYALMLALRKPSPAVAQVLISSPATRVELRSDKDESPLMLAAIKGQLELCRRLIARNADVNKPGWTALHYAATSGSLEVVQLLLERYAYIDAESPNGSTPLMMAALYGTSETVKLLLEAGADPTIRNALGLSALDFAQRGNKQDAVDALAAAMRARKSGGSW
jgi:ankyrin repeat protein